MYSESLYVFGDSWPAGAELDNGEKTFGELLFQTSNKFSSWENYSQGATSIPHLILQLNEALSLQSNSDITAVFFLTSPLRELVWDGNGPTELNPHGDEPLTVSWFSTFHSDELCEYRTNTTLLALQSICKMHSIKDYYLWGWDTVELWDDVDTTRFYPITAKEMFDPDPNKTIINLFNANNRYIWPNMGHPNQLGHELIAKHLGKFIE